MIRSTTIRNIILCVAVVALAAVLSTTSFAQRSERSVRFQEKKDFEVLSAGNANVLTTDKCSGLKILTVYVQPVSANQDRIHSIAKAISSSYLRDLDLVVFFVVERRFKSFADATTDEEEKFFYASVRGIYRRGGDPATELFNFFPTGVTEKDLDEL